MAPLPKWSNKTIERFLEIYRKHPCLFDFEDIQYASKPARQAAIESILRELAIPGLNLLDLKRKIHSIRNTYTNECRKIERSKKTDTFTEEQYQPRIPWFYIADKVLGPVVLSRRDRRASNNDLFSKVQAVQNAVNLRNVLQVQDASDEQQEEFEPTESLSGASFCTRESYGRPSSAKSAVRFAPTNLVNDFREKKSSYSRSYQQTISTVTQASIPQNVIFTTSEAQCKQEIPDFEYEDLELPYDEQNTHVEDDEDELETFARSVWLQMRRLPEEYNVQLMADIQTLISERRREYLRTKNK